MLGAYITHTCPTRYPNRNKTIKGGNKRKVLKVSNATGTKLLVKNLAFEATRNDLRELFGAFGQIKSVRIPRKFDGGTRGFGFIDFRSMLDLSAIVARCRSIDVH